MQYPVFKERSAAAVRQPPGNVLLSRPPSGQVPSALEGLTAVFGMGTGVSPPPSSPDNAHECANLYFYERESCSLKTEQRVSVDLPKLRRKEVIHPHLPVRIPCYDFTPIICPTFGGWLLAVTSPTSGVANSRGVTGGVYKARERIHRGMLIRDY